MKLFIKMMHKRRRKLKKRNTWLSWWLSEGELLQAMKLFHSDRTFPSNLLLGKLQYLKLKSLFHFYYKNFKKSKIVEATRGGRLKANSIDWRWFFICDVSASLSIAQGNWYFQLIELHNWENRLREKQTNNQSNCEQENKLNGNIFQSDCSEFYIVWLLLFDQGN